MALLLVGHLRCACTSPQRLASNARMAKLCRGHFNCSVFLVTWDTIDGARVRLEPHNATRHFNANSSAACLARLSRHVKPAATHVRTSQQDPLSDPTRHDNDQWPLSSVSIAAYRMMLRGILLALDLASRHGPFDYVVRLRPDVGCGITGLIHEDQWKQVTRHAQQYGNIFRCGLLRAHFPPGSARVRGDNCFGGHWEVIGGMLRISHDNLSSIAHGEPSVRGHPELALDLSAKRLGYHLTALRDSSTTARKGHT